MPVSVTTGRPTRGWGHRPPSRRWTSATRLSPPPGCPTTPRCISPRSTWLIASTSTPQDAWMIGSR
eukprot:12588273-Heterocapsa_arctica.AAC.1